MIVRAALIAALLAMAGCQAVKGPSESGQPVYYDPAKGISSNGLVYPRPQ